MPDEVPVDFTQEEGTASGSFEPIPDGEYEVSIMTATPKRAQSSGNPVVEFALIVEGPTHVARRLWLTCTAMKDKRWMLVRVLKAIGLWEKALAEQKMNFLEMSGRRFKALVTIEDRDGKKRNRINGVAPSDVAQEAPESPEKAGDAPTAQPPWGEEEKKDNGVDHSIPDPFQEGSDPWAS